MGCVGHKRLCLSLIRTLTGTIVSTLELRSLTVVEIFLMYPSKDVPHTIHLEGLFFKEGENDRALKEEIVHAWRHTHKKGKESLGKPNSVSMEPYLR